MKKPAPRRNSRAPKSVAPLGKKGARSAEILGRVPIQKTPIESVPVKWHWHYRTLLSLESRLAHDRGALRRAAAEPLEPHSLHEADSATDESDHDLALAQLSAEEDALFEVIEALRRIRDGRYGKCEQTGKTIPAARLRAVPWTRFTYAVEEQREKKGITSRAHLAAPTSVRGTQFVSFVPEAETEAEESEETGLAPVAPPRTPKGSTKTNRRKRPTL